MNKPKPKKDHSTWSKFRKFFNDIHLWGGLISGIVVFVVCLTGTIYVYNTELRQAALSEYYTVEKTGEKLSADSLLVLAKPAIKGKITGVKVSFGEEKSTAILYSKAQKGEEQSSSRRRRSNQMMINPYTGDVLGDATETTTKTAAFMGKMFGLHRWLLLNEIEEPIIAGIENRKLGSWITGTATLLFLLGVLSGLVIWFPKKMRGWKNGFKIRWTANWKRVNHDLHNTLGLYTWVILFLMAITGPFWSFEWYREGWKKTWGTYQNRNAPREEKVKPVSTIMEGKRTMTVEETILAVNEVLPYDGDITINFASDSTGTISIVKNRVGFFAPSAADRLTLDQYSGELLGKDIFREKTIRNRIGSSVKALHIGDVYGPFSKLLYFIGCLVATSLPVTGVLIWVNKMKKKDKKR